LTSGGDLARLMANVDQVMDALQDWLTKREAEARTSGDRHAAHHWQLRRLRLRAYRQGLVTLFREEPEPPPV